VRNKIFKKYSSLKSFEVSGKHKECTRGQVFPSAKAQGKERLVVKRAEGLLKEKWPSPFEKL
jgi:hypothetical protein